MYLRHYKLFHIYLFESLESINTKSDQKDMLQVDLIHLSSALSEHAVETYVYIKEVKDVLESVQEWAELTWNAYLIF